MDVGLFNDIAAVRAQLNFKNIIDSGSTAFNQLNIDQIE